MTAPPPGVLDGIPLFDRFTPPEREAVAKRGRTVAAEAGVRLVHQDAEGDALYVLLDGTVRVLRRDAEGTDVEIGRRGPGDCFGEMALIDGGPRSATIETLTRCRLFVLDRAAFLEVVSPSRVLLSKLLGELSRKVRDVSERVVQEDLERRTRIAEAELARHRAITQAVTGLAHELNTPLGVCVTTASYIESLAETDREVLQEPAQLLRENLERAVNLVHTFTTIAALHHAEPLEDLDLSEIVEHSAALYAMDRADRRLTVHVRPVGPCPWLGYRAHLQRALFQLLDNVASHAFPDGTAPVAEIAVEPDRLDGRHAWRVVVRDSGAGIPEEYGRKLFDAFFTTARNRGHKGLGLTIVFNTVTGPLAGRVLVEPRPGGGTAVSMILPQDL